MTELLPCPFCGSGDVEAFHSRTTRTHWIVCNNCAGAGPDKVTQELAIMWWNTRSKPQKARKILG